MDGRILINNKRITTPETRSSINPATLEPVGDFFIADSRLCAQAIESAEAAFPGWRKTSHSEKAKIFLRAKEIMVGRQEEIASLITAEKGSPLVESLSAEVFSALEILDYYIHAKTRLQSHKIPHHVALFKHKKSSFHFQPLGPTLIISPWNFPFIIPICDILSTVSAGNTAVLRPSSTTPLQALLIGEIFSEAGLPPGVLNVINSSTTQAEEMIQNPKIQTVMFTGSVPIGKRIMELASRNLTNITLELGGKDPMIVCRDADLERAARGAVWLAFMNCGQSCGSVERVYVDESIHETFVEKVVDLAGLISVGNPIEDNIDMGPMTTEGQLSVVEDHIEEAVSKGAKILLGGQRIKNLPGYFIQPAVLSHCDHTMKIMTEETFGPVLPIMPFSSLDQAVELANDSPYGLTASVWTRNRAEAQRLAEEIEAGTVTINDHMYSFTEPKAIWGGIKQTGIGRNHGPYGQLFLINIKYISLDFLGNKGPFWWFPYKPELGRLLSKAILFFHHRKISGRIKALFSLFPHMKTVLGSLPLTNFIKSMPRIFRK
jgi:acyl-CoA reductase-like NAD-dependent aldehyde dehydrogenase